MAKNDLHELEEQYEAALNVLNDLAHEYPDVSFERLRSKLDAIGTILSANAVEIDDPDEPLM